MAWSKNTPKEVIQAYDKAYRERNKDRINQQDRAYYRDKYDSDGRSVDEPLTTRQPVPSIVGPRPDKGQKAIYFLRSEDGVPYYVGSTLGPVSRMNDHKKRGRRGEMVIVRICDEKEVVYWESKLIVEMIEAGYGLDNLVCPAKKQLAG